MLLLGVYTLGLVQQTAPPYLFYAGVMIFLTYVGLAFACWKRIRTAFLGNIVLAGIVITATVASSVHQYFVTSGAYPLRAVVIITGSLAEGVLAGLSVIAYRALSAKPSHQVAPAP